MKRTIRGVLMGGAAVVALAPIGCQTYQVGQVLPSGYHLVDDVQYFPKGPEFPLRNELNSMAAAEVEFRPVEDYIKP